MTSVVALRPLTASDLDEVFEQMRDPTAVWMAAFTPEDPGDRAAFDRRMRRILDDPQTNASAITADGVLVGSISTFPSDEGLPEVTYWIARSHWGQGIAGRALQLMLDQTDRPLLARAASDNAASLRSLERIGFRQIGTNRDFAPGRGAEVEETLLRLE
ncbi:MAG: GNAT family N-acetyltransferase [Actinomycetota bacterium]|nr:GNAT family N-acetyltransferase [Actinomycetota bacterium]